MGDQGAWSTAKMYFTAAERSCKASLPGAGPAQPDGRSTASRSWTQPWRPATRRWSSCWSSLTEEPSYTLTPGRRCSFGCRRRLGTASNLVMYVSAADNNYVGVTGAFLGTAAQGLLQPAQFFVRKRSSEKSEVLVTVSVLDAKNCGAETVPELVTSPQTTLPVDAPPLARERPAAPEAVNVPVDTSPTVVKFPALAVLLMVSVLDLLLRLLDLLLCLLDLLLRLLRLPLRLLHLCRIARVLRRLQNGGSSSETPHRHCFQLTCRWAVFRCCCARGRPPP